MDMVMFKWWNKTIKKWSWLSLCCEKNPQNQKKITQKNNTGKYVTAINVDTEHYQGTVDWREKNERNKIILKKKKKIIIKEIITELLVGINRDKGFKYCGLVKVK